MRKEESIIPPSSILTTIDFLGLLLPYTEDIGALPGTRYFSLSVVGYLCNLLPVLVFSGNAEENKSM